MKIHTRKRAIFMRSVLLMVGLAILSMANAQCDMKPMGPDGEPKPVAAKPLVLTRAVKVNPGVTLGTGLGFGASLANAGDLDGGGGTVLAVGSTATAARGIVYLLSYNNRGTLTSTKKIENGVDETNADSNANAPSLADSDQFGSSLANAGDLDGGGGTVLAVGAIGDDTGGAFSNKGAIHLLSFDEAGALQRTQKIANGLDETNAASNANAPASIANHDRFGISLANAGDLDGGGGTVLAVGATGDDTGGVASNKGAIYLLSFDGAGALQSTQKIASGVDETNTGSSLAPNLANGDVFGASIANAGDLDGGGGTVLAVGAGSDDTGGSGSGAIYLLSFNANGNLTATTKITSETDKGPGLAADDQFGSSLANATNLDGGNGTVLAVGAKQDATGAPFSGAIHLLSFDNSGSLTRTTKIAHGTTNGPLLSDRYLFGSSIANAGDLDGSGGRVLAVGGTGSGAGTLVNKTGELQLLYFSSNKE